MNGFRDLCVAICSDVTVPYDELRLSGCLYLAHPGLCDEQVLLEADARHRRDNEGRRLRFLLGPHEDCLAEENALRSAMLTAAALRAKGYMAAVALFRPDKPLHVPAARTFAWTGLEDVLEALWSVSKKDVDWSYRQKVPTSQIRIAQSFDAVPRDGTLRFTADAINPRTIGAVRMVIDHFSAGQELPIKFGYDLDAAATCRLSLMLRGVGRELVAA